MPTILEWCNGKTATGEQLDPARAGTYRERRGFVPSTSPLGLVMFACRDETEARTTLMHRCDGQSDTWSGTVDLAGRALVVTVQAVPRRGVRFTIGSAGQEVEGVECLTAEEWRQNPCVVCKFHCRLPDGVPVACYLTL